MVSNAWLETLLSAINALPKETIKQEVRRVLKTGKLDSLPLLTPDLLYLSSLCRC